MEAMPESFEGYTLFSAYKSCWKKYITFSGRAVRSEFWYWVLANLVIVWALDTFYYVVLNQPVFSGCNLFDFNWSLGGACWRISYGPLIPDASPIRSIYSLIVFLPSLAVLFRRLHDRGSSGWSLLWILLPVIGLIILVVYLLTDSNRGCNHYGESEKYPDGQSFAPHGAL